MEKILKRVALERSTMLKRKVSMIQKDKEPFKAAAHSLDKFRKF